MFKVKTSKADMEGNLAQNACTVGFSERHLKTDEMTGKTLEDWFVVIPQLRVCR